MGSRKDCCEEYHICFNHDSWYCDECIRNKNMVDYLDIRITPMYDGQFDEFNKKLSKKEIQDVSKELLYDDDKYLQKVYQEILKEE